MQLLTLLLNIAFVFSNHIGRDSKLFVLQLNMLMHEWIRQPPTTHTK